MITRLHKILAGTVTGVALVGVCASPAQAADNSYWASNCAAGRACVQVNNSQGSWWNLDGCGFHNLFLAPWAATAHGNSFRVTYQDGRWDDVNPWSTRRLDVNNRTVSVFVNC